MISTFQALVVALIAIAPGAIYTFAYERHAGAYGVQLSDRLVRFLVASAVFHAVASWAELAYLEHVLRDGWKDQAGWRVEIVSIGYVAGPYVAGSLIGWGRRGRPAGPSGSSDDPGTPVRGTTCAAVAGRASSGPP